jgi:hypothetical protein
VNPTDLPEAAWLVRQWARRAAAQLGELRLGWQRQNRDLQQFWEKSAASGQLGLLHHLPPADRSALRDAAEDLEAQADQARHDLLRVQHAAGAIAHALGASARSRT